MTDDQQGEGTPQGGGQGGGSRWDPLPQGDYDDGATAFVQLPEGGIDALLDAAGSPLAAPGHGFVPPQITVAPATGTDPAATGSWAMPAAPVDGTHWQAEQQQAEQQQAYEPGQYGVDAPYAAHDDRFTYHQGATGHWDFSEAVAAEQTPRPAPGHDVTGQWSIPVAGGDLPDESGEFTTSSLVEQWGGTPPATLPGGAPAPWATQAAGQPWGEFRADAGVETGAETGAETVQGAYPEEQGYGYAGERAFPDVRPYLPPSAAAGPVVEVGGEPEAEPGDGVADGTSETNETHETHETHEAHEPQEAAERPAEAPEAPGPPDGTPGMPEAVEEPVPPAAPAAAEEPPPLEQEATAPEPEPEPAAQEPEPAPQPPGHEDHPLASYVLRVNGTDRPVSDAWIGESLLYVLRERLGLAGAKDGCSQGECGACNVQVDGRLVASCLVPAVTAAGSEVRTVEGLAVDGQPSDVQRALARCGAVQCGFCVPGIAMTVHDLLEGNPAPTELETRQALCGNLCRCSGYRGFLRAVDEVVAERAATADETEDAGTDVDPATRTDIRADARTGIGTDAAEPRIPHQATSPPAENRPPYAPPHDPSHAPPHDHPHDHPHGQDGGHA